jgi:hypothetical protein
MEVPGQPGQKSLQDSISMEKKWGIVVHAYHPSDGGRHKIGGSQVQGSLGKNENSFQPQ